MSRLPILLFPLLFWASLCLSQNIYQVDSLKLGIQFWHPSDTLKYTGKLKEAIDYELDGLSFLKNNRLKHQDLIYHSYRRLGSLLRKSGQLNKAQTYVELGLNHAKKYFDETTTILPNAYSGCALVYMAQEKYKKAEAHFLIEMDIRQRNGHPRVGDCMVNLGILFGRINQLEVAENYYQNALDYKRSRFPAGHVKFYGGYFNLVEFYHKTGEYEKALRYADSSYQIILKNKPPNHVSFGDHFNNISAVYQAKGDYREAAKVFQKAIDIFKKNETKNQARLAAIYSNFGLYLSQMGDFNKALLYFRKSLSIRTKKLTPKRMMIARTQNYIGNCYLLKNDLDAAEFWMSKALKIRLGNQKLYPNELADSYQDIGKLQEKIGFWKAALNEYEKALAINMEIYKKESHPTILQNHLQIGKIHLGQKKYDLATNNFRKALTISQKVYNPKHPEVAQIYRNLAACYPNNLRQSQRYLNKAYEAVGYHERGGLDGIISLTELLKILQTQARLLQDDEQNKNYLVHLLEAEEIYNEAFQLMDSIKVSFTEPGSKQSLLDNYFSIYEDAIKVNYDLYKATDQVTYLHRAFDIAEKSNNTLLVEALNTIDATAFSGIPDSLLQLENQLKIDIAVQEKLRFEEQQKGAKVDEERLNSFTNQIFDLKNQHHSLLQMFTDSFPRFYELKYAGQSVSVKDIQTELLTGNQVMVEYFVGDKYLYIFVITQDNFQVIPMVKDFPLEAWVEEMRTGIYFYYPARPDAAFLKLKYANIASELHELLIVPIEKYVTGKNLLIIPGGMLGYLPFEALLTTPVKESNMNFHKYPYLLKKHSISYNYSATHWQQLLRTERMLASENFAGFAPNFMGTDTLLSRSAGFGNLKFNRREIVQILKIMQGKGFLNEEATVENFMKFAHQYRILHLASHGVANDQTGDYSYLAFYQDSDSLTTDIIYVKDLYNLHLAAEMVVLSACETAIGEFQRGEGIVSLARGFFYAGAQSIVTTLWKLDDKSSLELMPAFYKNIESGMTKDAALQQAKLSFLENNQDFRAHPLYWASFVPVGNMKRLDFEEKGRNYWGFALGGILLLLGGIFIFKRKS
ncbi:MAG: CHAT domain-containing protein/Tfp pilus assembly protein PilF [Saprospiraceae bacterium]|jgi:CHAT domain-containing protein/Tfp pilus assembly protein PilF